MPLVKYTANHDPRNGTGRIRLSKSEAGRERVLVLGGPALELSEEEHSSLSSRYKLDEVGEENAGSTLPPNLAGSPLDLTGTGVLASGSSVEQTDDDHSTDHAAEGAGQEDH